MNTYSRVTFKEYVQHPSRTRSKDHVARVFDAGGPDQISISREGDVVTLSGALHLIELPFSAVQEAIVSRAPSATTFSALAPVAVEIVEEKTVVTGKKGRKP